MMAKERAHTGKMIDALQVAMDAYADKKIMEWTKKLPGPELLTSGRHAR